MAEVSGPFDLDVDAFGGKDTPFLINQTYIKFFPAEYHSQSAIDAALALRPHLRDVDEIEKITIETFNAAVEIIGGEPEKWQPTTRETADHSLPYCVAVALMEGRVTLDSFDDAHLSDKQLLSLVQKIEVKADAELNTMYPEGIPNRIRIHTRSGQTFEKLTTFPRGHAQNPMTDQEAETKFQALAEPLLQDSKIAQIQSLCWNLEKQDRIGHLLRLFAIGE